MNTFQPGDNVDGIGMKLMENLSEQLLPLFDMNDAKTNANYWVLTFLLGAAIQAQVKMAVGQTEFLKLAPAPQPPSKTP
jgi:hypothetical protein